MIIADGVQLLVITALDELILQDIVDGQSAVVFPVVVLKDCYDTGFDTWRSSDGWGDYLVVVIRTYLSFCVDLQFQILNFLYHFMPCMIGLLYTLTAANIQ